METSDQGAHNSIHPGFPFWHPGQHWLYIQLPLLELLERNLASEYLERAVVGASSVLSKNPETRNCGISRQFQEHRHRFPRLSPPPTVNPPRRQGCRPSAVPPSQSPSPISSNLAGLITGSRADVSGYFVDIIGVPQRKNGRICG